MAQRLRQPALLLTGILFAFIVFFPVSGRSQTAATSMSPGARIRGHCFTATVTQPPTIAYDPIVANLTAPATGTAQLYVTCTYQTIGTIDLDHGQHASPAGSYFAPNMAGSTTAALLSYFVYSAPGQTALWGTTTSNNGGTLAGTTVSITGTGSAVAYPVYIAIPPGQNVPADAYADTITATVSF